MIKMTNSRLHADARDADAIEYLVKGVLIHRASVEDWKHIMTKPAI